MKKTEGIIIIIIITIIIIIIIITNIYIYIFILQDSPSVQEHCYQRGPVIIT